MHLRVAFAQTEPRFGQIPRNLERAAQLVATAEPFDVLVLPELFATGYLFADRAELAELAEPRDGATIAFLAEIARTRDAWVAGGFAERDGESLYNSAALVGPDGTAHVYRKVHLFDRETELFDASDAPLRAFAAARREGTVRFGLMICFDWLFPECARCLALDGADVLLHPSNLVLPWCQDAMRTRCLENRVFAVTANRCGADDRGSMRLSFTGASQITGPLGDVVHRAAAEGEAVHVATVDLRAAREKQLTSRNDLFATRRPRAYGKLTDGAL